jgi:hypothetical protein
MPLDSSLSADRVLSVHLTSETYFIFATATIMLWGFPTLKDGGTQSGGNRDPESDLGRF